MTRARRLTITLLVVYLAGLVRVTLWPQIGADKGFDLVRSALSWLHSIGVPLTFSATEFVANIVLFVPFGVLVGLLARWPSWLVVLAGAVTSGVIELTQLLFLPDRVADVRDLVANTLGSLVGVLVLLWVRAATQSREPANA